MVGLPIALAGGIAAARLLSRSGNGWDDLIYAILGAIIGYTIGVSFGVSVLVLLAAEPWHLNQNAAVLQTFLFVPPPIGAILGFNMRRKARR